MIKPNKRKSTKEGINLISNIQSLTSNNHRGITLVALIITIIVMLILVGVSVITAINGGLFGTAKRAAKKTEKAKNKEQELAKGGRIQIDGTWYDSLADYVEGNPSEDQSESNIKFVYEPEGWTKGPVKVKIGSKEDRGQLQYSMDGITWENYTEEIEVENKGTKIYAREVNDIEEEVETVIERIDTEPPTISTDLTSPSQRSSSIDLEIGVTDEISGFSKIEWYYKKSTDPESEYEKNKKTDEDTIMFGSTAGKKEVTQLKTLSGLEPGTTYNIYAIVYDVAGNPTRYPNVETETINIETKNVPDGESSIGFSYSNENWTKYPVYVTIENKTGISKYKIIYSKDNITWKEYEEPVEMSERGNIYAKLVDDEGNEGTAATGNVANVDADGPTISVALKSPYTTESSIDLSIGVTDGVSGISKIKWYYKKDTDPESKYAENMKTNEYQTMNGKEAGETEKVTKTKTITGLASGTTYNIYAEVYDVAGNSTRSPEEGTINVQAVKISLLGKSATIDGVKYIVMYEPGETIEIDGVEYEIENPQLISADVLAQSDVELGHASSYRSSIASYNEAIETLNRKCEDLVGRDNPNILSVRCVGSNPVNPAAEAVETVNSTFLRDNPPGNAGVCNGVARDSDTNYEFDYARLQSLGALETTRRESYWLASRYVSYAFSGYPYYTRFGVRQVSASGDLTEKELIIVSNNSGPSKPQACSSGIRTVISIPSSSLPLYLD